MKQRAEELGKLAKYSREELAFKIFTTAFDTSFNTVDGETNPLCYSAHTSKVPGVANQSNAGSSALAYAAWNTARIAMMKFKDDSGKKIKIVPDTTLVPVDLEATAIEVLESMFKGDSTFTTSAISSVFKPKIISSVFLTDTNNWFLLDLNLFKKVAKWQNREPLRLISSESTETLVLKETGYYRCAVGTYDWRPVYGSNV